jgi:diguanylate cyclase (GGDEF)-like protein
MLSLRRSEIQDADILKESFSRDGLKGLFLPGRILFFSAGFVLLWVVSRYNYLLFHVLAEGFSIVVACLIFVLATRTYRFSGNSLLLFLGNAYLAVAIVDLFHTLAFKGMGVFPSNDPNTATQLWIAARYLESFSLLLATWLGNRLPRKIQFWGFLGIASLLVFVVMRTSLFPDCFIAGVGLTNFKIVSEYVISAILVTAMIHLWQIRGNVTPVIFWSLMLSMGTTVLSEMAFTLYTDVYGVTNGLGHILKIISFIFIYNGVVIRGLDEPYGEIFRKLKETSLRDPLTGIYNRLGFMESAERFFALARREKFGIAMLMMDIDNFKAVNDKFGHAEGDRVLKDFAGILLDCSRKSDIPCRLGGDEFVILMKTNPGGAVIMRNRVEASFLEYQKKESRLGIGLSIGVAFASPGESLFEVDTMMRAADSEMYGYKRSRSQRSAPGGV